MLVFARAVLLIIFCIASDYVAGELSTANDVVRALLDSSIHCVIGACCWCVIIDSPSIAEIVTCGIFSSLIDVDHFLAAKSISLKAALSLPSRPVFHAVIAIPFAALFLAVLGRFLLCIIGYIEFFKEARVLRSLLSDLPLILIIAWSSHQLRDSIRRGLWVWPFGNLPKTPYILYLAVIAGVPLLLNLIVKTCKEYSREVEKTDDLKLTNNLLDV